MSGIYDFHLGKQFLFQEAAITQPCKHFHFFPLSILFYFGQKYLPKLCDPTHMYFINSYFSYFGMTDKNIIPPNTISLH